MTGPRIGSLFSGYGGLERGMQAVLGGTTAWHSEIDPGACKILAHRYPHVPNLGDITAVDWSAVEPVDVLTGGFPCQDVSTAGYRKGLRPDTRSGLWTHFAYAIDQLRPRLVVIENVRGLLSADAHHLGHGDLEPCVWCVGDGPRRPLRALGAVLGELADLGYDASWQGLRASDVGAPHGRFRVFIIAWPAADAERRGRDGRPGASGSGRRAESEDGGIPAEDPDVAACGERWFPAPGQAQDRGARADAGRRGGAPAADTAGDGRDEGRPEPAGLVGGSDAAFGGNAAADPSGPERRGAQPDDLGAERRRAAEPGERPGFRSGAEAWGPYFAAIHRWERCLGRPAPPPTEPGAKGKHRLSAAAVEWMMGLPAGWVTDVPGLSRAEQLKALGNGVVPQQAVQALRQLLPDAT